MELNRKSVDWIAAPKWCGGGWLRLTRINGLRAAAVIGILFSAGGCSVMRVLYAPELTEHKSITLTVRRDTTAVATVEAMTAPADTGGIAIDVPVRLPAEPRPGTLKRPIAAADSSKTLPPETLEEPSITLAPSPPAVSIALPEEKRERLERLARAEMGIAERITTQIEPRLTSDKDQEKLKTVRGLIEQTHAALDRDDIQSAANLAHKAKLLATELLSR